MKLTLCFQKRESISDSYCSEWVTDSNGNLSVRVIKSFE